MIIDDNDDRQPSTAFRAATSNVKWKFPGDFQIALTDSWLDLSSLSNLIQMGI